MRTDQPLEILDCCDSQVDARHALQLIEADRLPHPRLAQTELGPLVRAGDAIEQLDDISWIRIGLVERVRKQGPRDGARLDMHPLSQAHQLRRVRVIQRYVQPLHPTQATRVATPRVEPRLT